MKFAHISVSVKCSSIFISKLEVFESVGEFSVMGTSAKGSLSKWLSLDLRLQAKQTYVISFLGTLEYLS